MIDVYWYTEGQSSYNVDIEIQANERNNLLADVIKQISANKITIVAFNYKVNRDKIVTIDITVSIENLESLNELLKSIRKVESVFEVNRRK